MICVNCASKFNLNSRKLFFAASISSCNALISKSKVVLEGFDNFEEEEMDSFWFEGWDLKVLDESGVVASGGGDEPCKLETGVDIVE